MKTGNIPERDKSARYENDAGDITTFFRLMMKKKGGGDVQKAEDIQYDTDVFAYRVEGKLFHPRHPEWITEVRETDTTIAEIREQHAEDEQELPSESASPP